MASVVPQLIYRVAVNYLQSSASAGPSLLPNRSVHVPAAPLWTFKHSCAKRRFCPDRQSRFFYQGYVVRFHSSPENSSDGLSGFRCLGGPSTPKPKKIITALPATTGCGNVDFFDQVCGKVGYIEYERKELVACTDPPRGYSWLFPLTKKRGVASHRANHNTPILPLALNRGFQRFTRTTRLRLLRWDLLGRPLMQSAYPYQARLYSCGSGNLKNFRVYRSVDFRR